MKYTDHVQKSIDYIEAYLKLDIDLKMCAKAAGYSEYHFLRIFKEATGETPAGYIRKRRLSEITKTIRKTGQPMVEVALEWGFNSAENFTRAFKKEHHVTPRQYKTNVNSLLLFEKLDLLGHEQSRKCIEIEPFIVEVESFKVYGYMLTSTVGKSGYEVPQFWNKYNCNGLGKKLHPEIDSRIRQDYGVSIVDKDTGNFDYLIGVKCDGMILSEIESTACIDIHSGTYAVFKTPVADNFTFVETIHRSWEYIFNEWLPNSQFEQRDGYQFETYCEASHKFSEEIYFPIKKK